MGEAETEGWVGRYGGVEVETRFDCGAAIERFQCIED